MQAMMNEVVLNFSEGILLEFPIVQNKPIKLYCVSPHAIIEFPWVDDNYVPGSITSVFAGTKDVFVIKDAKQLMRYNGDEWYTFPGHTEALYQVLGSSDFERHGMNEHVFVVGENVLITNSFPDRKFRKLKNYTNGQDRIASISEHFLFDENRGGIQTNIVTERGEITLLYGERKKSSSVPEVRRDIALGEGHYWTLLKNGLLINRCESFDAGIEIPGNAFIFDFWANENTVWIVSEKGKLFHLEYEQRRYRITERKLLTEKDFAHIIGSAPDNLFAVTEDRTEIFHYDGDDWWRLLPKQP
jgi:hypothetical protein